MKKKVFITILIIIILLICSIIGVWIFISPQNAATTLAKDNVINENTIDISNNTTSDDLKNETVVIEEQKAEIVAEPEKEVTKPEKPVVEKDVSQTSPTSTSNISKKTTPTNNTQNTKTSNSQNSKNTTTKSTTSPSNVENPKPKEPTTTKPVEKTTETKPVTQPTRCTHNNNHGMDVGNSGKWFNTKAEAIAYYDEKTNYWGRLWENFEIDDSEYYKNCPSGYEYWSCMYCNKWTINFYYR